MSSWPRPSPAAAEVEVLASTIADSETGIYEFSLSAGDLESQLAERDAIFTRLYPYLGLALAFTSAVPFYLDSSVTSDKTITLTYVFFSTSGAWFPYLNGSAFVVSGLSDSITLSLPNGSMFHDNGQLYTVYVKDGDGGAGDATPKVISVDGYEVAAKLFGSSPSDYDFSSDSSSFDVTVDGGSAQSVTLNADYSSVSNVANELNNQTTGCTWDTTSSSWTLVSGQFLTCTSDATGASSSIQISSLSETSANTGLSNTTVNGYDSPVFDGASSVSIDEAYGSLLLIPTANGWGLM